jgi:hypothetical protein
MTTRNPAAVLAAASGDIENFLVASTPGGIEAQEAAGQAALVRAADRLPTEIRPRHITREMLEKTWGIQFGAEIDELFVEVVLPAGWTMRASEHSMHSNLVDAAGAVRAGIFYKAAFYDRRADMRLERRYEVHNDYGDTAFHVTVIDRKLGTVICDCGSVLRGDYQKLSTLEAEAEQWLKVNFPNAADPLAYWDEA